MIRRRETANTLVRTMNISQSEQNYSYEPTAYNENKLKGQPEISPGNGSRSPIKRCKPLLRRSWHNEKHLRKSDKGLQPPLPLLSDNGSYRESGMGDRSFLPPESPCSSESTIQRILVPNMISPTTPGSSKPTINLTSLPLMGTPSDSSVKKRAPNLLDRISIGKKSSKDVAVPSIYKFGRKCLWEEFAKCLETATASDIEFVYNKDGTTIMHMVVMSRTGYINAFKNSSKECDMAPQALLETLLQKNPDLAKVPCALNGYTPLTYACLVCDKKYNVEIAAAMVRLFLKYCPESIRIFTKDGLSPVDIHVVSYSHYHQEKEDQTSLGRTSASVLRTLLTHCPDLANNRIVGDKIRGPIELLYKCNSLAFTKAVTDEMYDWVDEDETVMSDFTIPERRQKVLDTVSKWWIWTWTVLILKYGSLKQKKRGSPFAAVHTASMQIACPTPLLNITLYAFPRQIKEPILDKEDLGNLPLHAVCSWPTGSVNKSLTQSLFATRKAQAIARILEEYPMAIKVPNGQGETPLELATRTGTTWDGGVRRLVKAYPKALRCQSHRTGLYPFMTAAAAAAEVSSSKEREKQTLRTIYSLLRSNPKVLSHALQIASR